jgi:hypothetical protein
MALPPKPIPPDLTPIFLLVDANGTPVAARMTKDDAERDVDMRRRLFRQELTVKPGTVGDFPARARNARRHAQQKAAKG